MESTQTNKAVEGGEQVIIIEEKITKVNGDSAVKRYSKGRLLGKGGFAKCYETINLETKRVQAAKIIIKDSLTKSRAKQKLISEIKIHKSLHHINIVNFEHVFEDHENVYILLELCTNQTLNDLIKRRKRLTELEVQCYVVQMIGALKYMHSNRVIHRDLKLGNLFLSADMQIKIGDFGLAAKLEFDGEKKRTICGTPNYIAPEILDGKVGHSYEVDIWSLGVIIYTLLVGKPPFETADVKTTYKKIKMNSYAFPEHVPLSDAAKGLITRILNLDPARRPTLDEILEHPFINHGGTIPKVLPVSTLACPPSSSYLKQFLAQSTSPKATTTAHLFKDKTPLGTISSNGKLPLKNDLLTTQDMASTKDLAQNKFTGTLNSETNMNSNWNLASKDSNIKLGGTTKDFKLTQNLDTNAFTKTVGAGGLTTQKGTKASDVWVKKWVDYSSKYGLGYLLSNGATGVFFNDSSKILLNPKGTTLEYTERRSTDKQDITTKHSLTDYPKELQKKVTLLQHFKGYLEAEKPEKEDEQAVNEETVSAASVYVKKWMKTKHAIMFRLSNKVVQVNFTDKTEIILSSENKIVTYVSRKGERSNYPLASALESTNAEMVKRLKYTKEVLTQMIGNNTAAQGGNQNQGNNEKNINLNSEIPISTQA
jgi:polo-like kinase 1